MSNNCGLAICKHCGAEYRLFTVFKRDMQALCKAWKIRHERACSVKSPAQRKSWAKKYVGKDRYESSLVVDLNHVGFLDNQKDV